MTRLACAVAVFLAAAAAISVGIPAASELPVALTATATDYSVSFADDPALSFTFSLDGFLPGPLTTGGGWIPSIDLMDHASFGFVAGVTSSGPTGHLVYDDRAVGFRLIGIVANYTPGPCTAVFTGVGEVNGLPNQSSKSTSQTVASPARTTRS